MAVALAGMVVAALVLWGENTSAQKKRGAQKGAVASASLEIVVDGEVRRTWAGAELSEKQFIGRKLKGGFAPMVNLTDALPFEALGVSRERLVGVVITGGTGSLKLNGQALKHLDDLALEINVDKDASWKLIPKAGDAETALTQLVGGRRIMIRYVRRIELTTGPPSPPKS